MEPDSVYWDKPDLADDLRAMADNLFPGMANILRHAMLHSAARRIEYLESLLPGPPFKWQDPADAERSAEERDGR